MTRIRSIVVMMTGLWLGACANENLYHVPSGQKVPISASALDFFKTKYLPGVGSIHSGAFALSQSGQSAGYSYCPDSRCRDDGKAGQQAIAECAHDGEKCFIFAAGREVKYDYYILP